MNANKQMKNEVDTQLEGGLKILPLPEGFDNMDSNFFMFDEPGDSIEGTLLMVDNSPQFEQAKVYKVETKNKEGQTEIRTFFGTTALDTKLAMIKLGTYVFVRFNGMRTSKNKRKYKDFSVGVKPSQ